MLSLFSIFWAVAHYGGPMYKEWADSQTNKIKGILNAAREDHTSAVQQRIESVKQMGSVVDVTKNLFEVSKVKTTNSVSTCASRKLTIGRKLRGSRLKRSKWSRRLHWFMRRRRF